MPIEPLTTAGICHLLHIESLLTNRVCHGTQLEDLLTQGDCRRGPTEGLTILLSVDGTSPQYAPLDAIESLVTSCVLHLAITLRDSQLACGYMGLLAIRE